MKTNYKIKTFIPCIILCFAGVCSNERDEIRNPNKEITVNKLQQKQKEIHDTIYDQIKKNKDYTFSDEDIQRIEQDLHNTINEELQKATTPADQKYILQKYGIDISNIDTCDYDPNNSDLIKSLKANMRETLPNLKVSSGDAKLHGIKNFLIDKKDDNSSALASLIEDFIAVNVTENEKKSHELLNQITQCLQQYSNVLNFDHYYKPKLNSLISYITNNQNITVDGIVNNFKPLIPEPGMVKKRELHSKLQKTKNKMLLIQSLLRCDKNMTRLLALDPNGTKVSIYLLDQIISDDSDHHIVYAYKKDNFKNDALNKEGIIKEVFRDIFKKNQIQKINRNAYILIYEEILNISKDSMDCYPCLLRLNNTDLSFDDTKNIITASDSNIGKLVHYTDGNNWGEDILQKIIE